jgi:hypothetical protein
MREIIVSISDLTPEPSPIREGSERFTPKSPEGDFKEAATFEEDCSQFCGINLSFMFSGFKR